MAFVILVYLVHCCLGSNVKCLLSIARYLAQAGTSRVCLSDDVQSKSLVVHRAANGNYLYLITLSILGSCLLGDVCSHREKFHVDHTWELEGSSKPQQNFKTWLVIFSPICTLIGHVMLVIGQGNRTVDTLCVCVGGQ